jgi:hypothetical protein
VAFERLHDLGDQSAAPVLEIAAETILTRFGRVLATISSPCALRTMSVTPDRDHAALAKRTGGGSKRDVQEFIIHPNLVKTLRVGKCVCIKKYPESRAYLVDVNPN